MRAQERSGLSAAEHCRRNDLSWSQFLYWRSKGKAKRAGQFIPIGGNSEGSFKIAVKGSIEIIVPPNFDAAALKRLLEAVDA